MEVVAQNEIVSTAESQPAEDPATSRFTWTIENFSRINTKQLYSHAFTVGGYKWRVLIFPRGNNVDLFSMYLDVADSAVLPYGWSRFAQFSLAVVNQREPKFTIRKDTQHQFNARESGFGFTSFMPLGELYDHGRGYLVNDTLVVEAEVAVRMSYLSKKETRYVGLKNQHATSYMNSLLQTLYHIPYFRKAVYHMPTTENDMPSGSIPLALQSLFYKLQYSDNSVATKELTKSFGWDTCDCSVQQDVQELNRVLCEKLEDKMKGTVVEGTIQQLFEGHHINYIECINVDYKSNRKESFYDLQLDVKGCRDVYASFDKYVEVERLEGDNKYHAKNHGLQDAKKGVLFLDFPPVLQLQLKRFEYDYMRDTMVKINDRYEFPLTLDLDKDDGKYLAPDADRSVRNLYTLHSVLVHIGGVHGGHYYAFIRPVLTDQWFKFDDERVTKEDIKKALEEQYGGEKELPQINRGFNNTPFKFDDERVTKEDIKKALEEQYGGEEELPQINPGFKNTPFKFTKYSNAYMLVYIRDSDKEKIMCNVDEKDIAEHLRIRLKKEQEEKEHKKKEKAEAHLYTIIKVARDEDLKEQIGKDIYFDLVDHDKVRSFRIQKQFPFSAFKEEVAKEFGIPVQFQRYWLWVKRQNHTYRPNRRLTPHEDTQTVGQLREVSNKAEFLKVSYKAELKLLLEVELGVDLHPIAPPEKTREEILIFFKLYDPEKEELCYVGRLFLKANGKPAEIISKLNEMAGFPADEEIELFEEIKFEPNIMCEPIDKKLSFRSSQLEDGDIICFQKPTSTEETDNPFRYPDVPSFLEYVHNRQVVHFRVLEKPKEDDFSLELSKLHTYDDVVEKVAGQIKLEDPSKIRLTSHNCYSQQPKLQPIRYRGVEHLADMLVHHNQTSDILYYEVLDIPLPELQGLTTLKVAFHHSTKEEVVIHSIRLPKNSTVGDVITDLKTKVELSRPDAQLRLLEVFYHKIYKIFPPQEKIENINDQYWTLRAEEIPEEEANLGSNDRLIHVYHFMTDPNQNQQVQNFGEPFLLAIREGETLAEVKTRIQKKLLVSDEEFAKWKFAFLSMSRPDYLQDTDVVSSRFQRRDVYGAWEQYLGLEHTDTTPKRTYQANQIKQLEDLQPRNEQQWNDMNEYLKKEKEILCQENEQLKQHISILKNDLELARLDKAAFQDERDNAVKEAEKLRNQIKLARTSNFTWQELKNSALDFSESLKIGEGGYGRVYKGNLRGTDVAIKILNSEKTAPLSAFKQEVAILTTFRHPNLVTLIGACYEHSALVYEFLPNGSLENHLNPANNITPLTWQVRTRIMHEICLALIFLHSNKPNIVIHGDLKPDNVLLDANFVSKLGDFGISRLVTQSETDNTACYMTRNIVGTPGYIDPEFVWNGQLTEKSDVFSFGVIILRLLTGQSAMGIVSRVRDAMHSETLDKMTDKSAGEWPFDQAKKLAVLGLGCTEMSRSARPNLFNEVWPIIESLRRM